MNTAKNTVICRPRAQRGAALVVSMVLLLVLTLLAVSTMSTASLEVTMAGNAQYSENAFQLAETGNEEYIRTMRNNQTVCLNDQNPTVCDIPQTNVPEMGGSYQTTNAFIDNSGALCPNSSATVTRFDFQVQANGQSADNAISLHTQGWAFCKP